MTPQNKKSNGETEAEMMKKARERFDKLSPEEREKLEANGDEWQEKMNEGAGLSPEQIDADITEVELKTNALLDPLGETVNHDEVAALVTQEKLIGTNNNDEIARTLVGKEAVAILTGENGTSDQIEQIVEANGLENTAGAWNIARGGTDKEENEFIGNQLLRGDLAPIEEQSEEIPEIDAKNTEDIEKAEDETAISDEMLEKEKQKAEIIGDDQKIAQIEDLQKLRDKSEAEKMREQEQAIKEALDDALKYAT